MAPELILPLPGLDDLEGETVPAALPLVIDAHVHLFPDGLSDAIRQWLDQFAWPVRYRMGAEEVIRFLLSKGLSHIVALHYAHRPGMARALNEHMVNLCRQYPRVTGLATVFPGESGAVGILEEAMDQGLAGVKLHAHVQFFHLDSPGMHEIYQFCSDRGKPLVMHVGREPKNPDYPYRVDPYLICAAEKVERVLREYPGLRVCVPHMGADEFVEYQRLLEKYDNLWIDTTMVLADYLPSEEVPPLHEMRVDRIMYGTDFPNIPYAWDRELKRLCTLGLPEDSLKLILGLNAAELFSLEISW